MWEEMEGDPSTLENPQGIRMEASGCGGGIRWGKVSGGMLAGDKFRA